MIGLATGFLSAPVADGFFCEDLGPKFFPSFGSVDWVSAHVKSIGQGQGIYRPKRKGTASVGVIVPCVSVWFVSPTILGK